MLKYSNNALRRIQQIVDFYGKQKGNRIAKEVFDRADELLQHSELGPLEPALDELKQGHRALLVGTRYKIIYLIKESVIFVTDIFDVRQDPDKIKP